MTPNETGDATPGNRLVEWCWYDTCDASSSDFSDFMTDTNGVRHNHTVTAGLLNPRSWEAQLARRRDVITPLWQRMFAISTAHKLPLLTAIRSFDNTTSSFFDGKLLLLLTHNERLCRRITKAWLSILGLSPATAVRRRQPLELDRNHYHSHFRVSDGGSSGSLRRSR
jgi:hypothetical protein